ncbi:MAG: quinate 5-dehydrogenase [Candidatus Marinimicrobia bacterium]|nr:quinate 5-dehydrogenase [Candidatus Neomarinimicrobiota bacterium]
MMKQAVSVSIGHSKRDKKVVIDLLGEKVSLERIGTDGNMNKAAELFRELDGKVDAFGIGGADLGLQVDKKYYPLHSVKPMIRYIRKTPFVDGLGLKTTLERRTAAFLEQHIGSEIIWKRVLFTSGADRWGLAMGFVNAGWKCVFGDLMFGLGIPLPIFTIDRVKTIASFVIPIVSRVPFKMLYPTGEKQEINEPKFEKWYNWASVIAGDCHFVKHHMPENMKGKIVVTNTTTPEDVEFFRERGVKYMITTTPCLDGRSFGTNMMEAALVDVSGKKRPLTLTELNQLIDELHLEPQIHRLND